MSILWRWLVRPAIIVVFGAAGAATVEKSPGAGCLVGLISLLLLLWMIADIVHTLKTWGWL